MCVFIVTLTCVYLFLYFKYMCACPRFSAAAARRAPRESGVEFRLAVAVVRQASHKRRVEIWWQIQKLWWYCLRGYYKHPRLRLPTPLFLTMGRGGFGGLASSKRPGRVPRPPALAVLWTARVSPGGLFWPPGVAWGDEQPWPRIHSFCRLKGFYEGTPALLKPF